MKNLFIEAVTSTYTGKTILVKFRHRDGFEKFTARMFNLLITDKAVEEIIDSETAEVLFDKDLGVLV